MTERTLQEGRGSGSEEDYLGFQCSRARERPIHASPGDRFPNVGGELRITNASNEPAFMAFGEPLSNGQGVGR